MRIAIAVLTFAVGLPWVAWGAECERPQAAETAIDNLDSWAKVHTFFREFAKCDDGGIAEGVSDKVEILLSKHWGELNMLAPLAATDRAFAGFVVRHVDDLWTAHDLRAVDLMAQTQCPRNAHELCRDIHAQVLSLGPIAPDEG